VDLFLLAGSDASRFFDWVSGMPWFGWVAMVAIICGTVTQVQTCRTKHAERMEMIRLGMHPDGGSKRPQAEV
jgi:hypothetical protein